MSFTYEEKRINSLYIDKIWHTYTTSDGIYTAGLDGNWDIIISKTAGSINVTINGIGKRAFQVIYKEGVESVGIALKPGVFVRDIKGKDIVNKQQSFLKHGTNYVKIGENLFKIPDFASAEAFVDELLQKGVLLTNTIISSFNEGNTKGISDRSLRRHVAQRTGLSPYFFHQIQRAQHATQLLQKGVPIIQAAFDAGYTDQAHMTKALKLFIGRTPGQIISANKK